MTAADTADVVIVGGGVMGSAIAYFLTADAAWDGRVVVVERDPSYAECATTRSWGGVRQQFSTRENIEMGLFAADFVRTAGEVLAVDGEGPDLAFKENGYLFLASPEGLPVLAANCARQQALGADVALLTPDDLARRFFWLDLEGVAGAGFGLSGEGWIEPSALLQGFRRKARSQGAHYLNDRVTAIELTGGAVAGVATQAGRHLSAPLVVNAAGPQAGQLAALAGVDLPVGPRKRMSYVFDCRAQLPALPLVIDTDGVTVRPEGRHYIAIVSPPQEADPESHDLEADYGLFEQVIWPALARRIPAFEAIKLTGAWAGHYDFNAFDQNAILGPHPEIAGLYFCNGFSGHGIQQAPAAGRALAELILHGRYLSLDLTRLGYARLAEGRPLVEANVV